jgi:hypothetical protein
MERMRTMGLACTEPTKPLARGHVPHVVSRRSRMQLTHRAWVLVACAVVVAAVLFSSLPACRSTPLPPAWPAGLSMVGDARALQIALDRVQQLEHSPVAALAARAANKLATCKGPFSAHVDVTGSADNSLDALVTSLTCDVPASLAVLETARAGATFVLVTSSAAVVRGAVEPSGRITLHATAPGSSDAFASLLRAASEPAGAAVLTSTDSIGRGRFRVDGGIDVAALAQSLSGTGEVPAWTQLAARAVLDGTWEFAIYPPQENARLPRMAGAIGVRGAVQARAAMDAFLDDVQQKWGVHKSPLTLPAGEGACLLDLRVLAELAPCYVVTERAVVLGWNRASLEHALSAGARDDGPSRMSLDLAALPDVDRALTAAAHLPAASTAYPWRALQVIASKSNEAHTLDVTLDAP